MATAAVLIGLALPFRIDITVLARVTGFVVVFGYLGGRVLRMTAAE